MIEPHLEETSISMAKIPIGSYVSFRVSTSDSFFRFSRRVGVSLNSFVKLNHFQ